MLRLISKGWVVALACLLALAAADAASAVAERWRKLTQRIGVDRQRAAYRHVVRFEDNE